MTPQNVLYDSTKGLGDAEGEIVQPGTVMEAGREGGRLNESCVTPQREDIA